MISLCYCYQSVFAKVLDDKNLGKFISHLESDYYNIRTLFQLDLDNLLKIRKMIQNL